MNNIIQSACIKAFQLKSSGFNCSQSVFGALAEHVNMDDNTALKISSAFGGGMNHNQLCGAVVGAGMALGMRFGFCDASDQIGQERMIELTQQLANDMKEKYRSTVCGDLLDSSPETFECDFKIETATDSNMQYDNLYNIKAPICGYVILDAITMAIRNIYENEE